MTRPRRGNLAGAARHWRTFDGFMPMAAVDADRAWLSVEGRAALAQVCGAERIGGLRDLLVATARRAVAHVGRWIAGPR